MSESQKKAGNQRKLENLKFKIAQVDPRDMLNNFCFHVQAQKSLYIAENCNAFFLDSSSSLLTLSPDIRVSRAGSQLIIMLPLYALHINITSFVHKFSEKQKTLHECQNFKEEHDGFFDNPLFWPSLHERIYSFCHQDQPLISMDLLLLNCPPIDLSLRSQAHSCHIIIN